MVGSGGVSVVVGCEVDSGVVCAEDSKARVLVVIFLKTYMRTTPVPTNSKPADYEWMVILALPLGPPLSSAEVGLQVDSMRNPANRSWFEMYVPSF